MNPADRPTIHEVTKQLGCTGTVELHRVRSVIVSEDPAEQEEVSS